MSIQKRRLDDYQQDRNNANKGTPRGKQLLKSSLSRLKAGRSVLADNQGRIIAGNKTLSAAQEIGMTEVIEVETDGTQLVVVRRRDLDLETDPEAKELAIADNRIAELDLEYDSAVLVELQADVDLSHLFMDAEMDDHLAAVEEELIEPGQASPQAAEKRVQKKASSVRAVLPAEDVATFEQALRAAGDPNRGKALVKICRYFLNGQQQAEGQLNVW